MSTSVTARPIPRKQKYEEHAQSDEIHHDLPELVGVDYVQRRTDLSRAGVYLLARQGRIGGVIRVGRNVRFDRAKFETWFVKTCEKFPVSEQTA